MRVYIETYGCAANQNESEIMAGILRSKAHEIVRKIEDSDVIIVNTCYVKSPTEQKILFRLSEIKEKYPDKKLIIAGCMPEGAYDRISKFDASMISTHQITKIDQVVQKKGKVELVGGKADIKLCLPKIRKNPVVDIVPISSGCSGSCTYCAVRYAKGALFSYPKNKIIDEIKSSLNQGCKEIWVTSQDNAAFGIDNGKYELPLLLNRITKLDKDFSVRIGMMSPNHVKNILSDLISAYNSNKIYKFLHLPVQSGDNGVLKSMNRNYSVKDFEEIVQSFRDAYKMQVWTDVIVGYPDETESQFKNTMNLLKKLKLDYTNISRFGMRPGTPAEKLQQIPTDVVKKRSVIASDLVRNISLEKNKEWLGWKGDILVSEKGKKNSQWIGRNFAYKQVIIDKTGNLLGKKVKVKIIDALATGLMGWPIKD